MYDYYGVYASCRDAAWRCQIDFDMRKLPIKLISAAQRAGIRVKRNSEVGELRRGEAGASIYTDGQWIIVYDDRLPACEARMVLAHELGHILLGHAYKYADYRFDTGNKKLKSEREADMFAIRLLAPACILHELGITKAADIALICDIPYSVAAERAKRMMVLEERSRFYQSTLECKVRDKFSEFIENTRNNINGHSFTTHE